MMTNVHRVAGVLMFSVALGGAVALSVAGEEWVAPPEEKARISPIMPTPEVLRAGREIYMRQCAMCHGDGGKGDGSMAKLHESRTAEPPKDLTDPKVQAKMTDGEVYWKITTGLKKGTQRIMPGYTLAIPSEEDRWKVTLFVRSLHKQQ